MLQDNRAKKMFDTWQVLNMYQHLTRIGWISCEFYILYEYRVYALDAINRCKKEITYIQYMR